MTAQSTTAFSPNEAEQQTTSPILTSNDQGPPESVSLQGTSLPTTEDTLVDGANHLPDYVAITVIANPLTDNEEDGLRGNGSINIDVAHTAAIERQLSG